MSFYTINGANLMDQAHGLLYIKVFFIHNILCSIHHDVIRHNTMPQYRMLSYRNKPHLGKLHNDPCVG